MVNWDRSQGDKPEEKSEFWGEHWNKAKEKSMLFLMIMCQLWVAILPVRLLPVAITRWDLCQLNFCQSRALPTKTCSLNRGISLYIYIKSWPRKLLKRHYQTVVESLINICCLRPQVLQSPNRSSDGTHTHGTRRTTHATFQDNVLHHIKSLHGHHYY